MDLDFRDCFGREKTPSYSRIQYCRLDILGASRVWSIPFYSRINMVYGLRYEKSQGPYHCHYKTCELSLDEI